MPFTNQIAVMTVTNFKTSTGAPAKVQAGSAAVSSSNSDVMTVQIGDNTADVISANLMSTAISGDAEAVITVDGDVGDGVQQLTFSSGVITFTQNPNTIAASGDVTVGDWHDPV